MTGRDRFREIPEPGSTRMTGRYPFRGIPGPGSAPVSVSRRVPAWEAAV